MAKLYNRAKVSTATTGTGTVTLGNETSDAFCTFAEAGVQNSDVVTYLIEEGNDFELGRGTYTSSGTTLSRDTVLLSKIAGTSGTSKMDLDGAATVSIMAASEDLRQGRPYFSASKTSQSGIVTSTWTKGQFDTEVLDSDGCYDPSTNYRFTPTVNGIYAITIRGGITITDQKLHYVAIYKNGSSIASVNMAGSGTVTARPQLSLLVSLNGSTDYVEGYLWHNNGSDSTAGDIWFEGWLISAL